MEYRINTLSEFVSIISENKRIIFNDGSTRCECLLFRGQSDVSYKLLPSIARGRRHCCQITILDEERNMIEMAKYKMPEVFRRDMEPLELLALLQHHGVKTRLMDVTENALVALFFACDGKLDKDGEVIIFKNDDRDIVNYPVVNAIADSYRFSISTNEPLDLFYEKVIQQPYFLEQRSMLKNIHPNNEAGGRWIAQCCSQLLFVYAPIHSMRQRLQRGRYILFPNHIGGTEKDRTFDKVIDEIPKDHKSIVGRIIIPAKVKKDILESLELFGVSKEYLFGDSTDIVCNSIVTQFEKGKKQYY